MQNVECEKCGSSFERDNIYGTRCPNCKNLIEPFKEPGFIEENKLKLKKLQKEFLEKLKKRLIGDNNVNR